MKLNLSMEHRGKQNMSQTGCLWQDPREEEAGPSEKGGPRVKRRILRVNQGIEVEVEQQK